MISALCIKQRFANGQQAINEVSLTEQLTNILADLKELQYKYSMLTETIEQSQNEAKNNIQRQDEIKKDIAEMTNEVRLIATNSARTCSDHLATVKSDFSELTNETRQMAMDLADVKTQLQRQRAATHNTTTEISELVMLVKDQLTQEVNNSLVTVQQQMHHLSNYNIQTFDTRNNANERCSQMRHC
jgi:superfamily II RNA helicase